MRPGSAIGAETQKDCGHMLSSCKVSCVGNANFCFMNRIYALEAIIYFLVFPSGVVMAFIPQKLMNSSFPPNYIRGRYKNLAVTVLPITLLQGPPPIFCRPVSVNLLRGVYHPQDEILIYTPKIPPARD